MSYIGTVYDCAIEVQRLITKYVQLQSLRMALRDSLQLDVLCDNMGLSHVLEATPMMMILISVVARNV